MVCVAGLRESASRGEVSQGRFAALRARTSSTLDTPHHDQGKIAAIPEPLGRTATVQGIPPGRPHGWFAGGWRSGRSPEVGGRVVRRRWRPGSSVAPTTDAPTANRRAKRGLHSSNAGCPIAIAVGQAHHEELSPLIDTTRPPKRARRPLQAPPSGTPLASGGTSGRPRPRVAACSTDTAQQAAIGPGIPAVDHPQARPVAGCSADGAEQAAIGHTTRHRPAAPPARRSPQRPHRKPTVSGVIP